MLCSLKKRNIAVIFITLLTKSTSCQLVPNFWSNSFSISFVVGLQIFVISIGYDWPAWMRLSLSEQALLLARMTTSEFSPFPISLANSSPDTHKSQNRLQKSVIYFFCFFGCIRAFLHLHLHACIFAFAFACMPAFLCLHVACCMLHACMHAFYMHLLCMHFEWNLHWNGIFECISVRWNCI